MTKRGNLYEGFHGYKKDFHIRNTPYDLLQAVACMRSILLIHPPVAKPGEPPAGIAALAGCLRAHDVGCTLLDANLEALLFLIGQADACQDTRSERALRHRDVNLAALRTSDTYRHPGRYQKAVHELNHALQLTARSHPGMALSLTNCQDEHNNPLVSADLLSTAENFRNSLFFPWFNSRLPPLLDTVRPAYIGISLCYLSQALPTFALLGFLKDRYPEAQLILGGGLITSWMSNPRWHNPFSGLVDHCIAGPGEKPLLRLLAVVQKKKTYPQPDYTGLPLTEYLSPGLILPYAASRGCYWNRCSFCPETAEQSRYQPVPPATVPTHLRRLRRQLQPALIHFLDNAISPALLQTLVHEPPGVSWYGFTRIHEQLADPDFCRQLRVSGCVLLKLGLESGSQKVLDAMNKGICLELISRVLTALRTARIATYVYLLFGTPEESLDEARQTQEFVLHHHDGITFLNLAIFNMPINGTEAHLLPGRVFSEGDLSLYKDFLHPRNWGRRAVRTFLDREFRRQPQIAAILRRDPPFFSSNHAAFFTEHYP